MKLTPEEKQGLSPDEIAALEGEGADEALATMGDNKPEAAAQGTDETDETGGADGGASTDETDETKAADGAAAKKESDAGTLTPEQLAAIARDTGADVPAAELPTFKVEDRDWTAERAALRESRKAIQAQWDEGAITDQELSTKLDEVDDKLEALATQRATAETLKSINERAAAEKAAKLEAEESDATVALIKAAAASTSAKVDYVADKAAQMQFDMALGMLKADPANRAKTPTQLVQESHRAVLAIRGLQPESARTNSAPAPPTAPKPRDVPLTLGGLPNASAVPMQDETLAQASRMTGDELEQFMARLPPAQLAKLMRAVDGNAGVH